MNFKLEKNNKISLLANVDTLCSQNISVDLCSEMNPKPCHPQLL